jgi:hypothetical protein
MAVKALLREASSAQLKTGLILLVSCTAGNGTKGNAFRASRFSELAHTSSLLLAAM